jgi:hypothetical protein
MPKAGTHLLMKAVSLFPGIRPVRDVLITNRLVDKFGQANGLQPAALIGVDWPKPISLSVLRRCLKRIKTGNCAQAHICFSEDLVGLLTEMRMKSLLILRDPRDVVVSHANYVARSRDHFLFDLYQRLSESERLMESIKGVKQTTRDGPMLLNIYERYQSVMAWLSQPLNYTTYFEKLIGPHGGGLRDTQIEELRNIAQHLSIRYNLPNIERIADRLFGGTATFRKGIIRGWPNHFLGKHKYAFKEIAGQLLIDLGYEQDNDW